jgi:hypothetical protein
VNPGGTRKLAAPSREAAGVVQDAAVACVCFSPFFLVYVLLAGGGSILQLYGSRYRARGRFA